MRWFDILRIRVAVKRAKGDKMWCDVVLVVSDDVVYLDILGDEDEKERIGYIYMKAIEDYLPKILKRARENLKAWRTLKGEGNHTHPQE